jgi:DNA repair protein RadA/Sms
MTRLKSVYICQQCNYESIRWAGKCPQCGEWNTFVETAVERSSKTSTTGRASKSSRSSEKAESVPLSSIKNSQIKRVSTKISELDRVLGGGIVPGQVVLIAGDPGVGKSTILLQLADKLGELLYVSGEESVSQIKIRADRLGINSKNIQLLEESDIDTIIDTIYTFKGQPLQGVVIDSIQTMATGDLSGMAGSVGQVRECTYRLVRLAKSKNIPIFIVGHVTKQGSVAGPAVLMHLVDTVLWFEGDNIHDLRLIRAVKNRFGPTDEVGIFSMKDTGLIPISDSQKIFLTKLRNAVPGSVVTSVLKGTRPILLEIQALVVPTKMAFPKRNAQGIDSKKLEMLVAVLSRRTSLPLYDYDCFVNVTGGINLKNDPSADLATSLAIASAFKDKALPKNLVAIGEVGLLGDIRSVNQQDRRIKEAKRLGFGNVVSSRQFDYLGQVISKYLK